MVKSSARGHAASGNGNNVGRNYADRSKDQPCGNIGCWCKEKAYSLDRKDAENTSDPADWRRKDTDTSVGANLTFFLIFLQNFPGLIGKFCLGAVFLDKNKSSPCFARIVKYFLRFFLEYMRTAIRQSRKWEVLDLKKEQVLFSSVFLISSAAWDGERSKRKWIRKWGKKRVLTGYSSEMISFHFYPRWVEVRYFFNRVEYKLLLYLLLAVKQVF